VLTVIGASGYIGSHLVQHLAATGVTHRALGGRGDIAASHLGDVVWCIGLTGDFRARPHDAIDAHVSALSDFIRNSEFDSLTYLSSVRVYRGAGERPAHEEDELTFDPADFDDLYGLSKALGESIVLNTARRGRVARLSNVYGGRMDTSGFLSAVIRDATNGQSVQLRTTLDSRRDYVSVVDVVTVLAQIAQGGSERIYNVASGRTTTNEDLMAAVARLTGAAWRVAVDAQRIATPLIDISRVTAEFPFRPANVLDDLPSLVREAASPVMS
jgi:nucleoside-diphosphate-sugar epimerase